MATDTHTSPRICNRGSWLYQGAPAYHMILCLTLSILLAILHGYCILEQGFSTLAQLTRTYSVTQTELWTDLFTAAKYNSSLFLVIGTTASILGIWFIKVYLLWFLAILYNISADFKHIAISVCRGYICFIVFSILSIVILLAFPPSGHIGWLADSDATTLFVTAMTRYFLSLENELVMRLIMGLRISTELISSAVIVWTLDQFDIVMWRKSATMVAIMTAIVNLLSIVKFIGSLLSFSQ